MIEILRKVKAALPPGSLTIRLTDTANGVLVTYSNDITCDVSGCRITDDEWANNPNLVCDILQMLG